MDPRNPSTLFEQVARWTRLVPEEARGGILPARYYAVVDTSHGRSLTHHIKQTRVESPQSVVTDQLHRPEGYQNGTMGTEELNDLSVEETAKLEILKSSLKRSANQRRTSLEEPGTTREYGRHDMAQHQRVETVRNITTEEEELYSTIRREAELRFGAHSVDLEVGTDMIPAEVTTPHTSRSGHNLSPTHTYRPRSSPRKAGGDVKNHHLYEVMCRAHHDRIRSSQMREAAQGFINDYFQQRSREVSRASSMVDSDYEARPSSRLSLPTDTPSRPRNTSENSDDHRSVATEPAATEFPRRSLSQTSAKRQLLEKKRIDRNEARMHAWDFQPIQAGPHEKQLLAAIRQELDIMVPTKQ